LILYNKKSLNKKKEIYMRRVEKLKLPKWLVSRLPFGEEDETISSIVVPAGLFFLMGIGFLWYEVSGSWDLGAGLLAIALVCIAFMFFRWLLAQVDLLKFSRQELIVCYELTEEPEEKEKIKEKLKKLYVFVK
jgi:hypothetical protein